MNTPTPQLKSPLKWNLLILVFHLLILIFLLSNLPSNANCGVGINTSTPKSYFEVNGSFGQKVTSILATTTLDATYNTVICDNGATAISINLPTGDAAACPGRIYTIKKGSASTGVVTIDAYSTETIDGSLTLELTDAQGAVTLTNNGTNWIIISQNMSPFPMGEVSYFSTTGTSISISATSDGSNNMIVCNPTTNFVLPSSDFSSNNSGRLTYTGKTIRTFHIACTISASPATSSDQFVFAVAKNGTINTSSKIIQKMGTTADAQSTAIHIAITMSANDYLELYVGNLTAGRNVVLKSINLFALGI